MSDGGGKEIDRLIDLMAKLPGLGPRSARRAVLHLIKKRSLLLEPLARAMSDVAATARECVSCGNVGTSDQCAICLDPKRANGQICVVGDVADLSDQEMVEMMQLLKNAKTCLEKAIHPQGFNVGINVGRCAGAGLPGHLHMHLVPRWNGDTNFMSVCAETEVISQSMSELLLLLKTTAHEHGLPTV